MASLSVIFTKFSPKEAPLQHSQLPNSFRLRKWMMYEHEPAIDRPFLTPFHGWHYYSPSSFYPLPLSCLPLIGPYFLLPFFFFSVWFIFAVPSFLPFQKVMHTRKRHSELYHELNHSSKFHTIDRYSRDPAMSTFKVRPLPKRGMGTRCNLCTSTHSRTLSQP